MIRLKKVATKRLGSGAGRVVAIVVLLLVLGCIVSTAVGNNIGATRGYNNKAIMCSSESYDPDTKTITYHVGNSNNNTDNNQKFLLLGLLFTAACIGIPFREGAKKDIPVNEKNELILPRREPLPISKVKDIDFYLYGNRSNWIDRCGTLILHTTEGKIKLRYVRNVDRVVSDLLELKHKVNSEIKE